MTFLDPHKSDNLPSLSVNLNSYSYYKDMCISVHVCEWNDLNQFCSSYPPKNLMKFSSNFFFLKKFPTRMVLTNKSPPQKKSSTLMQNHLAQLKKKKKNICPFHSCPKRYHRRTFFYTKKKISCGRMLFFSPKSIEQSINIDL